MQVTPGGERTFRTCLGAADELQDPSVLPAGWADGCAWLHCEGYVLHRPAVALQVIRTAVAAGARVRLTASTLEHHLMIPDFLSAAALHFLRSIPEINTCYLSRGRYVFACRLFLL